MTEHTEQVRSAAIEVRPEHPASTTASDEVRVPTHEEISVRAYFLWEASAFRDDPADALWLQAERELCEWYAQAVTAPSSKTDVAVSPPSGTGRAD